MTVICKIQWLIRRDFEHNICIKRFHTCRRPSWRGHFFDEDDVKLRRGDCGSCSFNDGRSRDVRGVLTDMKLSIVVFVWSRRVLAYRFCSVSRLSVSECLRSRFTGSEDGSESVVKTDGGRCNEAWGDSSIHWTKEAIQYYPQLNSQPSHAKGKSIQTAQKLGTVVMTWCILFWWYKFNFYFLLEKNRDLKHVFFGGGGNREAKRDKKIRKSWVQP